MNLFIYESGPKDEQIEGVLSIQIQILNLVMDFFLGILPVHKKNTFVLSIYLSRELLLRHIFNLDTV